MMDFLGAIFFWYLLAWEKYLEENRNFVESKCTLFAARVPEDPEDWSVKSEDFLEEVFTPVLV